MNAIVTNQITKSFNDFVAVNEIDISVKEGELFGLLGPNGAGKTTLINLLSTMTRPTSGTGTVNGFDVVHDSASVRAVIGVVFQSSTLDEQLTGLENLDLHGRLYGLSAGLRKKRIDEVLDLVELSHKSKLLVKTYSGGMIRRLEIARGLMHHPKVLFLDEPTLGLDPQTRLHIWDYIRRLNREEGITIVLTTHYMEEADNLCDRIAIIDNGRVVALDTPEKLKSALGGDVIILTLDTPEDAKKFSRVCKETGYVSISTKDQTVYISVKKSEEAVPEVFRTAFTSGTNIQSITMRKSTLDDIFIHYTGRGIRDELVDDITYMKYKIQSKRR
ncbi:MAG: Vitamin B12 import ATP-binding protein BtuD [Candidatus Argoarchaeum ethanivorans]|uniref:Vitamin B12 import ATP-binding protein BtuD n=1 Tax=Candidatus Argoarchaeum ethanivorans TaxID=2608793 RepID=A0A811T4G9_9EURY|nr:MAG: Vitamin B12 import ATP-binding protein BtuD [Candidatus Argoarchaeum ethanivorans]